MRIVSLLALLLLAPACGDNPVPVASSDALDAAAQSMPVDMVPPVDLADPIVGRACGTAAGYYCPCGYFCPQGTCEIADFHPPCGDGGSGG